MGVEGVEVVGGEGEWGGGVARTSHMSLTLCGMTQRCQQAISKKKKKNLKGKWAEIRGR